MNRHAARSGARSGPVGEEGDGDRLSGRWPGAGGFKQAESGESHGEMITWRHALNRPSGLNRLLGPTRPSRSSAPDGSRRRPDGEEPFTIRHHRFSPADRHRRSATNAPRGQARRPGRTRCPGRQATLPLAPSTARHPRQTAGWDPRSTTVAPRSVPPGDGRPAPPSPPPSWPGPHWVRHQPPSGNSSVYQ